MLVRYRVVVFALYVMYCMGWHMWPDAATLRNCIHTHMANVLFIAIQLYDAY